MLSTKVIGMVLCIDKETNKVFLAISYFFGAPNAVEKFFSENESVEKYKEALISNGLIINESSEIISQSEYASKRIEFGAKAMLLEAEKRKELESAKKL